MKLVTRHKKSDCGICCLATVLKVSWHKAAFAVFGANAATKRAFATNTTRLVLLDKKICNAEILCAKSGHLIRVKGGAGWPGVKLPENFMAIVKIYPRGSGLWHWVIWDGLFVHDAQNGVSYGPEHPYPHQPKSYFLIRRKND